MLITANKVVCGDSYQTLKQLHLDSVDLIYIDPPFFANRVFEIEKKSGKTISFDDTWSNNIGSYLNYLKKIFSECKRVLKNTGSIYVHCDWHASHYLKITMDEIFGYKNFQNEIVWRRHNSHNDSKQGSKHFGRVHDVILFYSKTKDYTWNPIYQQYPDDYVKKYYRHVEPETGRRYAHGDLSGPGGHSKGNPRYEFLGVTRYWRFSKSNMKKLYDEGKIIQTKPGNVPVMKRYLDEMPGLTLQDVWSDIKSAQVTMTESCNYPTQKPVRLLERIIEISSNPNDVVLDPMCGSGTTLEAAKRLNRKYVGIDKNSDAIKLTHKRLQKLNCKKPKTEKPITVSK